MEQFVKELDEYQKFVGSYYSNYGYASNITLAYLFFTVHTAHFAKMKKMDDKLFQLMFRNLAWYCEIVGMKLSLMTTLNHNFNIEEYEEHLHSRYFELKFIKFLMNEAEFTEKDFIEFYKQMFYFIVDPHIYRNYGYMTRMMEADKNVMLNEYKK